MLTVIDVPQKMELCDGFKVHRCEKLGSVFSGEKYLESTGFRSDRLGHDEDPL